MQTVQSGRFAALWQISPATIDSCLDLGDTKAFHEVMWVRKELTIRWDVMLKLLISAVLALTSAGAMAQVTADLIVRTQNTYSLLNQAGYMLQSASSDSDNDNYMEPPAYLPAALAPVGGGQIPSDNAAPKNDGWGQVFGYCAFDNGANRVSVNRISGPVTPSQTNITLAVISAGADGSFDTSCADIQVGTIRNDDLGVYYSNSQVSMGAYGSGSNWFNRPAADLAALNGLNTSALSQYEVRLVQSTGSLYYFNGTSWASLSAGGWNDIAGVSSTSNKVGIGVTMPAAGYALDVNGAIQSSGAVNTATGFQVNGVTVIDSSRNVNAAAITATGVMDAHGGFMVNGVTVVDSARNIAANAITADGVINTKTGFQVNGVTVIDSSRNVNAAAITADGVINAKSGLQINGVAFVDASRNVTANTINSTGVVNSNTGYSINGVSVIDSSLNISANSITAASLSAAGAVNANDGFTVNGVTVVDASRNISGANVAASGWFSNSVSGAGLQNVATSNYFYSDGSNWNIAYAGASGIAFRNGVGGAATNFISSDPATGEYGWKNADGSWRHKMWATGQEFVGPTYLPNETYGRRFYNRDTVSVDNGFGIYFDSTDPSNYGIFKEPGAWAAPYPDLRIAFYTGIKIGAGAGYGGVRFYNHSDMSYEVMSIASGDSNVRISTNLYVAGVSRGNTIVPGMVVSSGSSCSGYEAGSMAKDVAGNLYVCN